MYITRERNTKCDNMPEDLINHKPQKNNMATKKNGDFVGDYKGHGQKIKALFNTLSSNKANKNVNVDNSMFDYNKHRNNK